MAGTLASVEKAALAAKSAGLYTGSGKDVDGGKKKSSFGKKTAGVTIVFLLLVALVGVVIMTPVFLIGTIKENLIKTLGFKDTVAIIEKVAEYKVKNMLAEGRVPDGLANDLLAQGIEVGQVTVAGDFVQTNRYLASLNDAEVAASDAYYVNAAGELAVRFNGEVVNAENFVAAVESSPQLYAAYSEALDISARYYHSSEVNKVYSDMGVNRNAFSSWVESGDAAENKTKFEEMLAKSLDGNYRLSTAGQYNKYSWECVAWRRTADGGEECVREEWVYKGVEEWNVDTTSGDASSSEVIGGIAGGSYIDNGTGGSGADAEQNEAQFLNTTLSSQEPYAAASAFMTVVSAIERAQVDGDGPVNEVMNMLSTPNEVTYVNTKGESVTENKSILETGNFMAAVSNGEFLASEASGFSRDRIIQVTNQVDKNAIRDTVASTNGGKLTGQGFIMNNLVTDPGDYGDPAAWPASALNEASNAIEIAFVKKSSETFPSVVGGNRIIEGGSFISNTLNMQVLGAMPSDSATVMAYQKEVNAAVARKNAAERATKNPFDISSPNTFMGNLMRSLAVSILSNYNSKNNLGVLGVGNILADLTSSSIDSLTGKATADGSNNMFATINGDCDTVSVVGASADLYCSQHNTLSLKNMEWTDAQWKVELGSSITTNEDGEDGIAPGSELAKFVQLGMDRKTTVGVKSADVCATSKEIDAEIESQNSSIFSKIFDLIKKAVSVITGSAPKLEASCLEVDEDIATGKRYAFTAANENREKAELYSAYIMHDQISSWLEDKESKTTAFRKKYTLDYMDTVSGDEIATTE